MPLWALLFPGPGDVRHEAAARHFAGAQAGQVGGVLLAVDHLHLEAAAQAYQRGQRDLEASGRRVNIDSPNTARPSPTQ